MKRFRILFIAAALCAAVCLSATAYAADVYPSDVTRDDTSGTITQTYILQEGENPADIPTADFERGGNRYIFAYMLRKNDSAATETKPHTQTVSIAAKSGDLSEALTLFTPELDAETEDGYAGTLTLDFTTIEVSADGYKTSSYTVTATRTYPNLSAADVSLIPKTTEEKGRTLTLDNVTWSEASGGSVDDYAMPSRYTATATYTGSASSKKATGFTATAEYKGEVSKTTPGPVVYVAVFECAELAAVPATETDTETEQSPESTDSAEPTADVETQGFNILTIFTSPLFILFVLMCVYFAVKRIKGKRRRGQNTE